MCQSWVGIAGGDRGRAGRPPRPRREPLPEAGLGGISYRRGAAPATSAFRADSWRQPPEAAGSGAPGRCVVEARRFRQDKHAVLDAPRFGERPLKATATTSGPLEEL